MNDQEQQSSSQEHSHPQKQRKPQQQKYDSAMPTEKPQAVQIEESILDFWDENKIFQKSLDKNEGKEPYVFFDGPPFATGLPHYGHILASAIKDAIPRYWTMRGCYVRRRWGWDCHGLPIEQIVEQKLGISGKKQIEEIGIDKFCELCRENVLGYVHDWAKTVRRIGRFVEFENSYKTMDSTYMESVWWALKEIWQKDLIYEGRKVLLYCPRCETPLSNFEVAMDNSYDNVTEESVYLQSRLLGTDRLAAEPTFILFWTTTPWTLPGNVALAIGKDIDYVMVEPSEPEYKDKKYVLAKAQAEVLFNNPKILGEFKGEELEGLTYEPMFDIPELRNENSYKIYSGDFVTTEDGTGVVHTAVVYGEEDYAFGIEHNLPIIPMLNARGEFIEPAPKELLGISYRDAEAKILEHLKQKDMLFKQQAYEHSVPFCWRCGTRLYYSAIPSWFINIQKLKPRLRELNQQQVNWYPDHLKDGRFDKGIESAPDWNISRNRFWATPLPFWKCENKKCARVECVGSLEELKQKAKNYDEVYKSSDIREVDLHRARTDEIIFTCPACNGDMRRTSEVVDCWFESASMPFAEFHAPFENRETFEHFFPAQFVSEYISQTRAWFYVTHVVNSILFDAAPFENVVATGIIQAEDGQKMSKSKKNFPDPNIVLAKYGADALRFYLLTSSVVQAENLNFSERELDETYRKLIMMLHNMHSFYRMYRKSDTINENTMPQSSQVLDRWILALLHKTQIETTERLDKYDLARAGKPLQAFVTDLSTWFVRRSRDRMKTGDSAAVEALNVLGYVIAELSKLLAPFTPMVADYLYKDITGKESVHLADWSIKAAATALSEIESQTLSAMEAAREIVELGLSARKEANMKVRQPLAELVYFAKPQSTTSKSDSGNSAADLIGSEFEQIIAEELNVKAVRRADANAGAEHEQAILKESANFAVSLSVEITPELREEGLARELERQIQDMRKKFGLQVGDMIDVYYNTADASLEMALVGSFDRKKTYVMQVRKELEVETDFEAQVEIEGMTIWLGITKI
jgi:isoleucyl-tRNA synthetase